MACQFGGSREFDMELVIGSAFVEKDTVLVIALGLLSAGPDRPGRR